MGANQRNFDGAWRSAPTARDSSLVRATSRCAVWEPCRKLLWDVRTPFREMDPEELRSLTEVFRRAGANDPEPWALAIARRVCAACNLQLREGVVERRDTGGIVEKLLSHQGNNPLSMMIAAKPKSSSNFVSNPASRPRPI